MRVDTNHFALYSLGMVRNMDRSLTGMFRSKAELLVLLEVIPNGRNQVVGAKGTVRKWNVGIDPTDTRRRSARRGAGIFSPPTLRRGSGEGPEVLTKSTSEIRY